MKNFKVYVNGYYVGSTDIKVNKVQEIESLGVVLIENKENNNK